MMGWVSTPTSLAIAGLMDYVISTMPARYLEFETKRRNDPQLENGYLFL